MSETREFIGNAADRDGAYFRVNGDVVFERFSYSAEPNRRAVFEAQRQWAFKNLRAAGRIAPPAIR